MLIFERRKLESQLALRRMSMSDLADMMGTTRQNLYAINDGDRVYLATINKLSTVLGCGFYDLVTDTEKEEVPA